MTSTGFGVLGRVAAMLLLVGALGGCATSRMDLMRQHLGVRPDEPHVMAYVGERDALCKEYRDYADYAQQLQEAYHTRATQNRWWIYVAAITGLGAAAASGALAAATAVTVGTLALLSISGGFAAGVFGTLDNTELAKLYTAAANRFDQALQQAEDVRLKKPGDESTCATALTGLKQKVSEARTKLELGRTNTAAGAIIRATEEKRVLDELIKEYQKPVP